MTRFILSVGVVTMIILQSCSNRVHTAFDRNADFSTYKSFCWMDGCEFTITGPSYLDNEQVRSDVQRAIIENFKEKGLSYNAEDPDLVVAFRITVEHETAIIYHKPDNESAMYRPLPEHEFVDLIKGSIVIDIVDKKEAKMVWRSEAMGYMEQNPDPSYKNIYRGIKRAMKDFPPDVKVK